ncbi:MAG: AglZ/HisF2 family acetamidino modification protein [Herminiimonas sp.]|uniref:AglZ/HisF2 family acetamidino modification protein n=1 Tax=Herminiimonas sp. TaxID=1926289 RepID=UPI0027215800|nr:AglZ/HisF2 family acetamidino modification protein [Herminiimonas sp.]MDO9419788.1 AglZ/HisF2 family acetamidino modification protein [Herminiimonas sp.]
MLRTRVIPCLLLKDQGLVKTIKYKDPKYVGDPINAIRIFNDKAVDELMLLDITATVNGRGPSFDTIESVASECFMPLAYGGGIRDLEDIRRILAMGVEKVVINTLALDFEFISKAAKEFGSQAIVASIDVKKKLFGGYEVVTARATKKTGLDPVSFAKSLERSGAGEILLSVVDLDGTQQGYDVGLITQVADSVGIPVIAIGGAGKIDDFELVIRSTRASAVAAGSMFVFKGVHKAVLISFPTQEQLINVRKVDD